MNDIADQLDLALTDLFSFAATNTNTVNLGAADWTRNMLFEFTTGAPAPTATITLNIPATAKGIFVVLNRTDFDISAGVTGGQSQPSVTIPSGGVRILTHDGSNVRPAAPSNAETGSTVVAGFIPPTFMGAQVRLNANETIANDSLVNVDWDVAVYDTEGFWNAANPSRLTIPTGVKRVKLLCQIAWEDIGTNTGERFINIDKRY
jgi:hypothetical protein